MDAFTWNYPKFLSDCQFNYFCRRCKKGRHCAFRHTPNTRGKAMCPGWLNQQCFDTKCPLRHIFDPRDQESCPTEMDGVTKCRYAECPFYHRSVRKRRGAHLYAYALKRRIKRDYYAQLEAAMLSESSSSYGFQSRTPSQSEDDTTTGAKMYQTTPYYFCYSYYYPEITVDTVTVPKLLHVKDTVQEERNYKKSLKDCAENVIPSLFKVYKNGKRRRIN